jgi:hypothetical protein
MGSAPGLNVHSHHAQVEEVLTTIRHRVRRLLARQGPGRA